MAGTVEAQRSFAQRRLLHILALAYVAAWAIAAIRPVDRSDWLIENLLVFVALPVLALTYRRMPFSDSAYVLIALFLTLHAIGAHYTYAKVPIGGWMREMLNLERNHFDRVVHFSFGLLLLVPMRELLMRTASARGFLSYALPVTVIVSFSGFFEIVEAIVAQIVSPELGTAYLGTQGDEWDAQKDMAAAVAGAAVSAVLLLIARSVRKSAARP
jgi:putative membrane protein